MSTYLTVLFGPLLVTTLFYAPVNLQQMFSIHPALLFLIQSVTLLVVVLLIYGAISIRRLSVVVFVTIVWSIPSFLYTFNIGEYIETELNIVLIEASSIFYLTVFAAIVIWHYSPLPNILSGGRATGEYWGLAPSGTYEKITQFMKI